MKKSIKNIHKVPIDLDSKYRLRNYTIGLFPYLETGSAVKKAIQKDQILLNDKIGNTGDWVEAGDVICFNWIWNLPDEELPKVSVFYEDMDLMVVRKPPGVSSSGRNHSLQHHLMGVRIEANHDTLPFPYLVHRLDKATEGLMIAAKNMNTRRLLAAMIENHSIIKHYVLIVAGEVTPTLQWIKDDIDGKSALTEILHIETLNTKDESSRISVRIHTGRKHQIRTHFNQIGHPIIGDNLYNNGGLTFGTGLLLCAYYIEFVHPISKDTIKVEYPIPTKISKYKS